MFIVPTLAVSASVMIASGGNIVATCLAATVALYLTYDVSESK